MFNKSEFLESLQSFYNSQGTNDSINFIKSFFENKELNNEDIIFLKFYLAREYFFHKDFANAETLFLEILENSNKHLNVLIYLAEIYWQTKRHLDSILLLNQLYYHNLNYENIIDLISLRLKILESENNFKFSGILANSGNIQNKFPLVSIIILCYNKVEYTQKCLKALFQNTKYPNFEVIVLDNASVDDTPEILLTYGETIKYIRAEKNLGFVGGNNYASQFASGEYIVFLNNDTEPEKGWLKNLLNTFDYYKDAGAAGSMLIYPDGKLQEAGGVIFNDASGWNYGKGLSPNDSRFTYCREVDYCSGAALMIKKDLFEQIGKFDERYSPAYYEDTDLCFSVRKFGYKVYFNPFSKVIHYEGATAGTDLNSGFKRYQVINSSKFIDKWKNELKFQFPNDPKLRYKFSDRNKGKRILIIDDIPPLPDRAAGALRHYHTLKQMLNLGYKVTYVHLMGKQYTDDAGIKYLTDFKMKGVEFIWFNYEYWYNFRYTDQGKEYIKTLIDSLDLKDRAFDFVYIAFWHIAEYFIDLIKAEIPSVPVLIDTMDIHYLREEREAEISKDNSLKLKAIENKRRELAVYSKADVITTVTEADRSELRKFIKDKPIFILTDVHDPKENTPAFKERKDLIFVGNFNHKPNEDAVLFFTKEIFPTIKSRLPEVKFYIVGNNPTEKVKALKSDEIIITGWVPDVKEYIDKCRIEVVPLRFGAGNKGKVGEALSSGIPIVTTSIGAEGMGIENGIHAFICDEPTSFAQRVIELYQDENLWKEFSIKGKKLIASQYSSELMRKRLQFIFNNTKKSLKSTFALNQSSPPKVSFIVIAHNQVEYTKKCIDSLKEKVKTSYEVILIDNASTDATESTFSKGYDFIKYFHNKINLGFPAGVNQGIRAALGDYILILNNDTILTDNLIERLIEVAESDPQIGIVGPISNEVSGLQKDENAKYNSIEEMHKYAAEVREKNKGQILHFPRVAFLCTLIKREVIDKIGGLDERFSPGNYEDDDFCLRAQLAGYKTVIAKDVFIHHYGSKSFKAYGEKAYAERLMKNQKTFVKKWGTTPDEIWLRNKQIKPHQIFYPIDKNLFLQHFRRVRVHLADNELELAQIEIEKAIENYQEGDASIISKVDLLDLAGNLFLANNKIEKAQYYFEQELQLAPNSSNACLGLGKVLFAINQAEAAKTMFEWALKNDSNNSNAIAALQEVNLLLGLEAEHSTLGVVQ
ncbi:Glycosyltransferase [Ignavibacterium album JCM 16511]|uniref:Glycosyltransferase n=1 Tax=Ignavibacterium album (strain DSM 19864 / JCM 16511 / NBRC 101810 / Mat9-16) TaxID=945713 RepID=I0AMR6_IGNAJ|nr:glycosyltransferase [Ignavibacterium album]AFH50273.1 Glycosyltransferase [Ignavibacterium album JCM 16511]